jgi:EAL domain-containing protein (putative c-di-GMP-specific phosphodiesterase class I)
MRRSASEVIRNLETRIARLERQATYAQFDRNASIEKASVYKMRRAPKDLKKAIQAYLLSGGVNVDIRDLKKEKVSPELSALLKDAGLPPSARLNVFELFERFMPKAYHESFEGVGR